MSKVKIIINEFLDWEPAIIILHFSILPDKIEEKITNIVKQWFKNYTKNECKFFKITEVNQNSNSISILIQWLGDSELEKFYNFIHKNTIELQTLEIGEKITESIQKKDEFNSLEWLTVSQNSIDLENGLTKEVQSFKITKDIISVGLFQQFCQKTQYLTEAERDQNNYMGTYLKNDINMYSDDKFSCGASVISYNDAMKFCAWFQSYLPTEEQWLLAMIQNKEPISRRYVEMDFNERKKLLNKWKNDNAITNISLEITGTIDPQTSHVVYRSGPIALYPNWQTDVKLNRRLFNKSFFSLLNIGFRVRKDI